MHKKNNSVFPKVVLYCEEHCLLLSFEKMDSCLILNGIVASFKFNNYKPKEIEYGMYEGKRFLIIA